MLQRKTTLNAFDEDCLVLYGCALHLCGHAKLDSHWMERTPFYKRGREVRNALYGPIIPSHLDPEYPNRTMASIYFEGIHGRVPHPGDVLRYEELADLCSARLLKSKVEQIQGAWTRRLRETPCPFRYEDGKMLIHQDDGTWKLDWLEDVARIWSDIEDDAFDRDPCPYPPRETPDQPSIRAVVFIESKDGKRRVKPFETKTDASMVTPHSEKKSPPNHRGTPG
jgi:hypothetical protein